MKIYLGAINWGSQTHMLGRAPTLEPQRSQLLCWFLPSRHPPFPNTARHKGNHSSNLLFFPAPWTQTHFIFLRTVASFVALPADCFDTSNELSHHLVVIAIMKLSTNSKTSTKIRTLMFEETNCWLFGTIWYCWNLLIAKTPKHSQSHSYGTQTNLWSISEFWLLPAIKPPYDFISNDVKENTAAPPHLPNCGAYNYMLLPSLAFNTQPILIYHDILITGHPFPASVASPKRNWLTRPSRKFVPWSEPCFLIP